MPSDVKCPGTGCKRKESCYLYTCQPTPKYQAFFTMSCSIRDPEMCKFYKSNEGRND